jgi:hypothetical protein
MSGPPRRAHFSLDHIPAVGSALFKFAGAKMETGDGPFLLGSYTVCVCGTKNSATAVEFLLTHNFP